MDHNWLIFAYGTNMIVGSIASALFLWFFKNFSLYFSPRYKTVPRSLRLFLLTSCLPAALIVCWGSIIFSLYFFLIGNEAEFFFKVVRLTVAAAAQHLRGSLVIVVIERIVSTVALEKHAKRSAGYSLFFILTFFAYFSTFLYVIPSISWIFLSSLAFIYNYLVYVVLTLHILIIVIAKMLHLQNQKMYSLLAYRVSLRQRYQIVENIKILGLLWSKIVIFTVIGPLGVIAAAAYNFATGNAAPTCLFLITYNLSFIVILANKMKGIVAMRPRIGSKSEVKKKPVISPLGKTLPTFVTTETYFITLQHQWN